MRAVWFLEAAVALLAASFLPGYTFVRFYSGLAFVGWIAVWGLKNLTAKFTPPKSSPVPAGKIRLCVAGMTHSAPTAKAHIMADMLAQAFPEKYETWYYWDAYTFYQFTKWKFDPVPFPPHLKGHATTPFCWIEEGPTNKITPIGGCDYFEKWIQENVPNMPPKVSAFVKKPWRIWGWYLPPYFGKSYHFMDRPATAQ
jgi:hypothetical protein